MSPVLKKVANLIRCLLESQSQYGFTGYWKFKLVTEKKAIFLSYRVVKEAGFSLISYKRWRK